MTLYQPVTEKQQVYRTHLLAQIHLSQKYTEHYAVYDEDYRTMLERYFNVHSVEELNIDELKALLSFLNYYSLVPVVPSTAEQLSYLRDRWSRKTEQPVDSEIRKWCYKLFGFIPLQLGSLSKQQINCLINSIDRI